MSAVRIALQQYDFQQCVLQQFIMRGRYPSPKWVCHVKADAPFFLGSAKKLSQHVWANKCLLSSLTSMVGLLYLYNASMFESRHMGSACLISRNVNIAFWHLLTRIWYTRPQNLGGLWHYGVLRINTYYKQNLLDHGFWHKDVSVVRRGSTLPNPGNETWTQGRAVVPFAAIFLKMIFGHKAEL
eukprot:scaffold198165_cov19-Tisochrysis_lutea.AAC.1